MQDFIQAIADEHVYLFDGAMGTMLYAKGVFINKCYDELNVRNPEIVLEVHRQYVRCGAEIIETNTYGANRVKLRGFGIEEELREINIRAAELARKAAGDSVYVAGAIGPLGIRIEPYGPTSLDEAREFFREQAEALRDGGVDLIIAETFSNISEIEQCIAAIHEVCNLPVVAQMTIGTDGRTVYGDAPKVIAQRLDRARADVIGLNCSVGPDLLLDAVEELASVTAKKISCQPNAGLPRDVNGRQMYMASPEYFSKYAKRLIHKGVKFIGGCCGTTPEHVKMMGDAVRPLSPRRTFVIVERNGKNGEKAPGSEPVPMETRSNWGRKLAAGEVVTTIEIVPPKGPNPEATAVFDIDSIGLTNMASLRNRGLDLGGNPFGEPTKFTIGVGVNPGHLDLEYELRRLEWKVKAGAEYAITQPVFDVRLLENFLRRIEHMNLPIVAGIWPLLSYRNAQFMNNEVPGVSVPDDVIERMRIASDKGKEFALHEGVTIARETLSRVRDRVAGVQVSAPLGRVDMALQVFGEAEPAVSSRA